LLSLALGACATPALRADATIRYQTETKRVVGLPAALDDSLKAVEHAQPSTKVLRIKGHMMVSGSGGHTFIFDLDKREFTFIDTTRKFFSILPFSDFADLVENRERPGKLNSGKCLGVEGGNTADSAAVILFTCHGGDNQKWQVQPRHGTRSAPSSPPAVHRAGPPREAGRNGRSLHRSGPRWPRKRRPQRPLLK